MIITDQIKASETRTPSSSAIATTEILKVVFGVVGPESPSDPRGGFPFGTSPAAETVLSL